MGWGRTYLDGLEGIENIQLGDVEKGVVVDGRRVLEDNEVQPSASPFPASADTPLATCDARLDDPGIEARKEPTNLLKLGTSLAKVFSLEDAATNSGGISLDHTNHMAALMLELTLRLMNGRGLLEFPGVDGQASEDSAEAGVAAGDVGVCACIDMLAERAQVRAWGRLP